MKDLVLEERLLTGVKAFDEEHRTILKCINELRVMLQAKETERALKYVKEVVLPLVYTHLEHEEELMKKYGFPEAETHKKSHDSLKKLFEESLAKLNGQSSINQLNALLMGWLFGHIEKVDKKYGKWWEKQGLLEEVNKEPPAF